MLNYPISVVCNYRWILAFGYFKGSYSQYSQHHRIQLAGNLVTLFIQHFLDLQVL